MRLGGRGGAHWRTATFTTKSNWLPNTPEGGKEAYVQKRGCYCEGCGGRLSTPGDTAGATGRCRQLRGRGGATPPWTLKGRGCKEDERNVVRSWRSLQAAKHSFVAAVSSCFFADDSHEDFASFPLQFLSRAERHSLRSGAKYLQARGFAESQAPASPSCRASSQRRVWPCPSEPAAPSRSPAQNTGLRR